MPNVNSGHESRIGRGNVASGNRCPELIAKPFEFGWPKLATKRVIRILVPRSGMIVEAEDDGVVDGVRPAACLWYDVVHFDSEAFVLLAYAASSCRTNKRLFLDRWCERHVA